MLCGTGWTLTTGDQIINQGESLLYGLLISTDEGEGDCAIYDGLDATSGRLIFNFLEADTPITDPKWDPPLRIERGLYIDFGNKMNAVLVQWDPIVGGRLPGQRET